MRGHCQTAKPVSRSSSQGHPDKQQVSRNIACQKNTVDPSASGYCGPKLVLGLILGAWTWHCWSLILGSISPVNLFLLPLARSPLTLGTFVTQGLLFYWGLVQPERRQRQWLFLLNRNDKLLMKWIQIISEEQWYTHLPLSQLSSQFWEKMFLATHGVASWPVILSVPGSVEPQILDRTETFQHLLDCQKVCIKIYPRGGWSLDFCSCETMKLSLLNVCHKILWIFPLAPPWV